MKQFAKTEKKIRTTVTEEKKSKIALYWENRQGTKGEIINMQAVLK